MNYDKSEFRWVKKNLRSFTEIDVPSKAILLNFQGNNLTDFIGLGNLENAETLILDDNPILSFMGVSESPNLKNLSMLNTPVSKLRNFKQLSILAFGFQLEKLNGIEITTEDKSRAYSYGNIESTSSFIARGWLPKRPPTIIIESSAISSPTSFSPKIKHQSPQNHKISSQNSITLDKNKNRKTRKPLTPPKSTGSPKANSSHSSFLSNNTQKSTNSDSNKEMNRINTIVLSQEDDPISVRFVRIMKHVGYTNEMISDSLIDYFSTDPFVIEKETKVKKKKKNKHKSKFDKQIEKNEEIINSLALQINELRNQTASISNYQNMLHSIGASLIQNQMVLENGFENQSMNEKKSDEDEIEEFEHLRNVMVKCVDADPLITNQELIEQFSQKFIPGYKKDV